MTNTDACTIIKATYELSAPDLCTVGQNQLRHFEPARHTDHIIE